MEYFTHLHFEGFRRLSDVKLELRPLCVLIGANSSGKTSVLDGFSLLANSAQGRLKKTLSDFGGIGANLTGGNARWMAIKVSTETADHEPIHYRLALRPQGAGYEVVDESLYLHGPEPPGIRYIRSEHGTIRYLAPAEGPSEPDRFTPAKRQPEPGETALSTDPGIYENAVKFHGRLASIVHYHTLDVGSRAPIRLPQPLRPADLPGVDGEDLVSCLYSIRESDRDRFELIEDTLRAGFSGFERLEFPPVAAGMLAMTWRDKNFSKPFYTHQLAEGMLRFLWLVTLLQSPALPAVTLIDEPEVSLHPELLRLLAELLREASLRAQVIVATHADRLVRFLEPREIVTLDVKEDGTATAAWADTFDLDAWLTEYTLDEVWGMGRIGGRS
jgi:predicted ATPase